MFEVEKINKSTLCFAGAVFIFRRVSSLDHLQTLRDTKKIGATFDDDAYVNQHLLLSDQTLLSILLL